MRNLTEQDFKELEKWGLEENPLASLDDYSALKLELRWLNPRHRLAHEKYKRRREEWIQSKDFDHYYKTANKKFEKRKWEYLKLRKAWYICPLDWNLFADPDTRYILDLGCGDGDVLQRVAEYIVKQWENKEYSGHRLEIIGVDLNVSRIENARDFCQSPHPKIHMGFDVGDAVAKPLDFPDKYFDYVLCTGVLEILADGPAKKIVKELCRLASKGIYIEDLADEYPGGFPRENLGELFRPHHFVVKKHFWQFTEPFTLEGSKDPLELWPILKDQVLFLVPDNISEE